MAITHDDIFKIADELNELGIRPTLNAVRKKLGSGSYTTISEAMTKWHDKQLSLTVKTKEQEPLPQPIVDAVNNLAKHIWHTATDIADKRLDAEQTQLTKEREKYKDELLEIKELANSISQENEELKIKIEKFELLKKENISLIEKLASLKNNTDEEIKHLKETISENKQLLVEARTETKTAIKEASTLKGSIDAYKEQIIILSSTKK